MNTMLQSALFAAIILFVGIYAFDAVYKNVNTENAAQSLASMTPAAGDETMTYPGEEVTGTQLKTRQKWQQKKQWKLLRALKKLLKKPKKK